MKRKVLFFLPRILGIILSLFFLILAFDTPILSLGYLIHLLPGLIILLMVVLSWKYEFYGGFGILFLALLSIFFFNTYRGWISFLIVSFPLFLLGGLFLLDYYLQKKD